MKELRLQITRSFTHPDTMKYGHRSTLTSRIVQEGTPDARLIHTVRLPDDTTREFDDEDEALRYAVAGTCLGAAGAALQELVTAVHGVCAPLLTASDGDAMWCAIRGRPGAAEAVERLEVALAAAESVLALPAAAGGATAPAAVV